MPDWLNYSIPWWIWLFPSGGILAAAIFAVYRTFGLRAAISAAVAIGSALMLALSFQRGRQRGWQDRREREKSDAEKTIRKGLAARNRVDGADPKRLRDDDGFKRNR